MRKSFLLFTVVFVILLLLMAAAVGAITDGVPDGNGHPHVGLMVADDANGNPLWRCSGTLMSPRIFLTAGHCTEAPAVSATIWFEPEIIRGDPFFGYPDKGRTSVEGTTFTHPQYDPNAFFAYDLGVVVLKKPVHMDTYGALPELGIIDTLATERGTQNVTFTPVGYGLQGIIARDNPVKGPVFIEQDLTRMVASVNLIDIQGVFGLGPGASVVLSNNAAGGGTCFGDSGGPNFLGDSNIVAAVTSFGVNQNCAGTGGGYRVDTPDDLEWLATFGL